MKYERCCMSPCACYTIKECNSIKANLGSKCYVQNLLNCFIINHAKHYKLCTMYQILPFKIYVVLYVTCHDKRYIMTLATVQVVYIRVFCIKTDKRSNLVLPASNTKITNLITWLPQSIGDCIQLSIFECIYEQAVINLI